MGTDVNVLLDAPRLLWRRKGLILLVTLASVAAAWAEARRTPPSYAAEQTLLYRFGREYFPVTPGEQRRNWGENVMVSLDSAIFTEMRLLSSTQVFEKTVQDIGPEALRRPQPGAANAAPTTGPAEAAALAGDARALGAAFDVSRVQGAALVTVAARNGDPAVADDLVARQVANYLAAREEIFNRDASAFYAARIAEVEARQDRLSAQLDGLTDGADLAAGLDAARAEVAGLEAASPVDAAALGAARARRDRIAALALRTQPIETEIAAASANLALLLQERADAELSHAYRREVAPVVEVVDRRTAFGNAVGLSPTVKLPMAGIFGFAFAALLVLALAALNVARERAAGRA
jgi:hypothetical protein